MKTSNIVGIIILVIFFIFLIVLAINGKVSKSVWVWIASFLTIGIMSFLWKDNPLYKLCEHIYIGVSAGYWFVFQYYQAIIPLFWDKLIKPPPDAQRELLWIIPTILGLLMLTRLIPRIGWWSRWPMAFIIGFTSGFYFTSYIMSNALVQLKHTIIPLIALTNGSINWYMTVGNIIIIVGTLTGLVYFFFSLEHKGILGGTAKVGIYFLMISFGAAFGYTVMARISLLIGRLSFLFHDWLLLIK